jgi:hypothetical protein
LTKETLSLLLDVVSLLVGWVTFGSLIASVRGSLLSETFNVVYMCIEIVTSVFLLFSHLLRYRTLANIWREYRYGLDAAQLHREGKRDAAAACGSERVSSGATADLAAAAADPVATGLTTEPSWAPSPPPVASSSPSPPLARRGSVGLQASDLAVQYSLQRRRIRLSLLCSWSIPCQALPLLALNSYYLATTSKGASAVSTAAVLASTCTSILLLGYKMRGVQQQREMRWQAALLKHLIQAEHEEQNSDGARADSRFPPAMATLSGGAQPRRIRSASRGSGLTVPEHGVAAAAASAGHRASVLVRLHLEHD